MNKGETVCIGLCIVAGAALIALALGLSISLRPEVAIESNSINCISPGSIKGEQNGEASNLPTQPPAKKDTDHGMGDKDTSMEKEDEDNMKSASGKYRKAAIQSDNEACAKIGMDIMMLKGGSAVDGTVAAMFCQSATLFPAAGIGGGHFMTVYGKEKGKTDREVRTFIARETLPAAGSQDYFRNRSSLYGGTAVGVPGSLHGMYTVWQMYGRVAWEELVAPTIKMCEEGFVVVAELAHSIEVQKEKLMWPENINLRNVLTSPSGNFYKKGDIMRRPRFANTLKRIATDPMSYYKGSLADDIVADIRQYGGEITKDDMMQYQTRIPNPVKAHLSNLGIIMYGPPPPSSGIVLEYIMRLLDGFRFSGSSIKDTASSTDTYQKLVEVYKFAFGRRSALGDPNFADISEVMNNMTSVEYINDVRSRINAAQTQKLDYYDHAYNFVTDKGTTQTSVLGPDGEAVSVTATNNYLFGSLVYGSRTGIMFNNEMDDFSVPGKINVYGIAPSPANFPAPGKIPMSSMSPMLYIDDASGEVALISGGSGGPRIISSSAFVAMANLYFGLPLNEAMDLPRLHHQLLPNELKYEPDFNMEVLAGLKAKGHNAVEFTLSEVGFNSVGAVRNRCMNCRRGLECFDLCIHAVSDKRKLGGPWGY